MNLIKGGLKRDDIARRNQIIHLIERLLHLITGDRDVTQKALNSNGDTATIMVQAQYFFRRVSIYPTRS